MVKKTDASKPVSMPTIFKLPSFSTILPLVPSPLKNSQTDRQSIKETGAREAGGRAQLGGVGVGGDGVAHVAEGGLLPEGAAVHWPADPGAGGPDARGWGGGYP